MKYFVTSDVHSFFKELLAALNEAGFKKDNPEHVLCICGDLFDRGDESVQLFKFVKELQSQNRLIYIRGNHEDLMEDCIKEIQKRFIPSSHHFSNGTIKTLCQFSGEDETILYDPDWRSKICENIQPVLDFIKENCVDYVEIGDFILTHGWIPSYSYLENFRDASELDWKEARWLNGMEMWENPANRIKGKTIICGHWNCSWGWSHIRQERKEFPQKNRKDWQKSFDPFIDDGIMAIDACCVYSGKLNVITFEA